MRSGRAVVVAAVVVAVAAAVVVVVAAVAVAMAVALPVVPAPAQAPTVLPQTKRRGDVGQQLLLLYTVRDTQAHQIGDTTHN